MDMNMDGKNGMWLVSVLPKRKVHDEKLAPVPPAGISSLTLNCIPLTKQMVENTDMVTDPAGLQPAQCHSPHECAETQTYRFLPRVSEVELAQLQVRE